MLPVNVDQAAVDTDAVHLRRLWPVSRSFARLELPRVPAVNRRRLVYAEGGLAGDYVTARKT